MLSKRSVTKAASAAAVMSAIAVPSVVTAASVVHPIQDMTIAQGTEKTIYLNDYLSNLSSYKVTSQSVTGVVYATYSYSGKNPLSLRGDQVGSSLVTISNDSGKLDEFKVHVLDAGADKRIDIGDVTRYVAAHPVDVTQAADVRTLLNGIEPLNSVNTPPTPGVNGKPNPVVLVPGQVMTQTLPVASYFTKTAEESLKFYANSSYDYIKASIDQAGVLTLTGTSALGEHIGTTVEITVTAANQYEKSATLHVPVTIQAGNIPVIKGTPNPINWKLGVSEAQTVSVATYFSSSSPVTYKINTDKLPSYIAATIGETTGELIVINVNPSSVPEGRPSIQIIATNASGSASLDIPVLIEYPIPVVTHVPNPIEWIVGATEAQTLYAAEFFMDRSGPGTNLTYSLENVPSTITAAINKDTGQLIIQGVQAESDGSEVFQVKATNPFGYSASVPLTVHFTVKHNPVPVVVGLPDPIQWIVGQSESQTVSMATYIVTEPDSPLTYRIVNKSAYIDAAIDELTGRLTMNSVNLSSLPTDTPFIQVAATNTYNNSAIITIPVLFEYLAPGVSYVPDPIEWIVGDTEAQTLNAAEFFMDRSGPGTHLTYSLENVPSTITAAINKDTGKLVIQGVQTISGGSEVVQVKATNLFGKSASVSLRLNIVAPYTINWKKDDPVNYPNPYSVPLSTFFDGTGATDFEISPISWDSHVSVSVANNHTEQAQLVFEGIMGDTTFTALGNNPNTGISKQRTIRFITDYDPPTIAKEAEHVTVFNGREGEGYPLYLNQYFKSLDSGDSLQYSIVADTNLSGEVYAALRGSGDSVRIEFFGAYFPDNITTSTVVKVKGTNMYGKSAILDIPVTVEAAPPPMVVGYPEPITYTDGLVKGAFQIRYLYEFLSGDRLDLEVENAEELRNQYHTSAGIDGADLFVEVRSPLGNQQPVTFNVKVKATDRFNQSALLMIPFTVNPNAAPVLDPDGINTIYLDNQVGYDNIIDLDLLGLFTDADIAKGDKLSYSAEMIGNISGGITADHYLSLMGSSIDMGTTVKVSAQDRAGNIISKTISVQGSPLGDSNVDHVNSNSAMTVIYPDTILPALPSDSSDKSKAIYLVDLNNLNNLSYNAYHMSNDNYVTITNGSSLNYPATINLHYVNKVDHTLTLDVFPIIGAV